MDTSDGTRTLRWEDPDTGEQRLVSPSRLAAEFLWRFGLREGPVSSDGVNGMLYWTTDGQQTLRDLANEHGLLDGANRRINRSAVKQICDAIPPGR